MLVRDVMTPAVPTGSPTDTGVALRLRLNELNAKAILITDGEEILGIATPQTLATISDEQVAPVTPVEPVAPTDDIDKARTMLARGLPVVPVVDGGMCVGIVTADDIEGPGRDKPQTELRAVVDGRELPGSH